MGKKDKQKQMKNNKACQEIYTYYYLRRYTVSAYSTDLRGEV